RQLALVLDQQAEQQSFPPIQPVCRQQPLPLSYAQRRLWLIDQIEGSSHYHMTTMLKLSGEPKLPLLNASLTFLTQRHESLRTVFVPDAEHDVVQIIRPPIAFEICCPDLAAEDVRSQLAQLIEQPFDLQQDNLLRAYLLQTAAQEHLLLIVAHHIILDGWSLQQLTEEFCVVYRQLKMGLQPALPALRLQYADYACWQQQSLVSGKLEQQLLYWEQKLAGMPQLHRLPLDKFRPPVQSFRGAQIQSVLPPALLHRLNSYCQSRHASLFMGLHAIYSVLLAWFSYERDIVIGTPVANRSVPDTAQIVGFFVNTLVLRSDLSGEPNFHTVLDQSKTLLSDAYAHQETPFEMLVARLQPERTPSYSPLVQVMLVLQNQQGPELQLDGLQVTGLTPPAGQTKYDLSLIAQESPAGLELCWEYSLDLFDHHSIQQMADSFIRFTELMLEQPEKPVFLMEPAAKPQLLKTSICDQQQAETTLADTLSAVAARYPQRVALQFDDAVLSYAELEQRATELALCLQMYHQVQPDSLVGICMEHSFELVIAMLAVLKCGAAFVPLDPEFPLARRQYMLGDSGACLVIGMGNSAADLHHIRVLLLDDAELTRQLQQCRQQCAVFSPVHGRLAYVIYTSGTTGMPKGVMLGADNLLSSSLARREFYGEQQVKLMVLSSYALDCYIGGLFWSLLTGGSFVIVPKDALLEPAVMLQVLDKTAVNYLMCGQAVYKELLAGMTPADLPALQTVILGGEAFTMSLVRTHRRLVAHAALFNEYGPTEATVWSSCYAVTDQSDDRAIPIGQARPGAQLYAVNAALMPVPAGAIGELLIGGDGIAAGYLNNPQLTQQRFVRPPWSAGRCLYRTGDLVRWLPDGNFCYLGRIDQQVKIRGLRVELSEIENVLLICPDIQEAVVLALKDPRAEMRLVAYVVMAGGEAGSAEQLRQRWNNSLAEQLPRHMLPAQYVVLPAMPLTPNGKINRAALPCPDWNQTDRLYRAPRHSIEQALCEIYQCLLGVERVGIDDNFFALGGHSLLATRLLGLIQQRLKKRLPLKAIFSTPDIAGLAELLATEHGLDPQPAIQKAQDDLPLQLSFAQQRMWLLSQIEGSNSQYNIPLTLMIEGPLQVKALEQAIATILQRHQSLRTVFKHDLQLQLHQHILPATGFSLKQHHLCDLAEPAQGLELQALLDADMQLGFDLGADLMLRGMLIQLSAQQYCLQLMLHHIAADGWSVGILSRELSAAYHAACLGIAVAQPAAEIQYADYAQWQRSCFTDDVLQSQLDYWSRELAALPAVHQVPTDFARPALQSYDGAVYHCQLDSEVFRHFRQLCLQQGATLYMGLHAIFTSLLALCSNSEDIVIGCSVANREQPQVSELIGLFANVLVIRTQVTAELTVSAAIAQSKQKLLAAYANQQVPFEMLVERLQPERHAGHSPLFQIMLDYHNHDVQPLQLDQLEVTPLTSHITQAKYELSVNAIEQDGTLHLSWEYNTALFDSSRIVLMAQELLRLMSSAVQDQSLVLRNFPVSAALTTGVRHGAAPAPVASGGTQPPVNAVEQQLQVMWAEVLSLEPETLGVTDNFFELGGNSLAMIKLITKVHQQFQVRLPVQRVFEEPVIRQMATLINLFNKAQHLSPGAKDSIADNEVEEVI
ncbi:MAG TPA: hypothetical protein DF774_07195, partial [Rheinheimera sp.]|uniref:non-ribosomal peptide synthetase n=1 Tax=Rheinheimera sp. TaxID=1869214 RepID=UPI000ECEB068